MKNAARKVKFVMFFWLLVLNSFYLYSLVLSLFRLPFVLSIVCCSCSCTSNYRGQNVSWNKEEACITCDKIFKNFHPNVEIGTNFQGHFFISTISEEGEWVSYQRSSNASVSQSNKVLSRSLISPSQSSTKKLNGSTLQRSKNSPTLENIRTAPTSLHMSLSLGPLNSTASTTRMRKSLIMERIGDKDIVKRAFKAFQNSLYQGKSDVDMRYSGSKKVLP